MENFGIREMQEMQIQLQEQDKDQWDALCPETGKNQLLWMIGEIGEVIDILKKHGAKAACSDEALRAHLIEEMADVLMYYNDVLLCYGVTPEEFAAVYRQKHETNLNRW